MKKDKLRDKKNNVIDGPFVIIPELFCDERGLKTLKGHRSVGGFRASLYNAMPEEGVDALISTMQEFENSK